MKTIQRILNAHPTSDGAGVKLNRYIGTSELRNLDPFLMLDLFGTDQPQDYLAGFPPHPHRGFETVTYLIAGKMRHQDNAGNQGLITPGGVQWMTAGKGIIHSEMPEQTDGLLQGIQLWINLPASHKMTPAKYQDYDPKDVPLEVHANGSSIRVISGTTPQGTQGPIKNELVYPTFFDVTLSANDTFEQVFAQHDQTFILLLEGQVQVADKTLNAQQLALLGDGTQLKVDNILETPARFILVSGQPIKEPIVQRGPFVMNTQTEIEQAFADFKNGLF